MKKFELNPEQKRLKVELLSWICNNETGYYGVLGAGGTGKTTVVCNVLADIKESVIFLGATNKVVTVLKESLIIN